ncbi:MULTISPECIES: DUF4401 domain-containing protein [Myroides]|uniref:DUF4401 domain-containing protein n=1 Tax=Myroides odoratimimus TaxID=76832 RepID=A0AAI8C6V5_9FLAO|nr:MULTISPECIES: DUF4401 domain-containing protein [Myroides]ALU27224.1 hypothetical protein AS202_14095 [Myroides odoratimimus]APA93249.1 hypothetical protein BK054_13645 [Myroides sp. ZB35]EKB07192.1 hypothetical protein HMPREF9711_00502 [Myroides odoratimimus CCUG 3837]MCA4792347.1 DUF4401 domain-containing protein [Myroides odoratimimus]MCA4807070.1 DUF4401 domain-containing protein [Myroides odoratimimus]
MNSNQFKDIVTSLIQKGVEVEQDALQVAQSKLALKSIIIRVISVIGSLIGLGLFMGFIALISSDLFSNNTFLSIMGLLFLVGSFALNRSKDSAVTDSLVVSFYIIGYAFMTYGFGDMFNQMELVGLFFSLLTLFLFNNQIVSFISSVGTLIALQYVLYKFDITPFYYIYLALVVVLTTYLFWQEQKVRTAITWLSKKYLPIFTACFLYTITTASLLRSQAFSYHNIELFSSMRFVFVITVLALIIATVYLIIQKMKIINPTVKAAVYLVVILFNVLITLNYVVFGITFLYMLWSFMRQYKVGFGISIVGLVFSMIMYYYDLGISLLEKSLSMMGIGVLFLGIYYLIQKGEGQTNEK